jgi:hypothetical protein
MTDLSQYQSEETPPKAGVMINTFRAFGYNLPTAIADIIDNSISAKASNVWIDYEWKGAESSVVITDDGSGMDAPQLIAAMTPGSKDPNDEREEEDLGRFGLGLKTSSFSQCKQLTVVTKRLGFQRIQRCWDLDYVNETGKWTLLDYLSDARFTSKLDTLKNGTAIVWQKLDRLVGNASVENEAARTVFLEEFEQVEQHLRLVFHRFIERNRLNIHMNGRKLEAWDPFLKGANGVQIVANEKLSEGKVNVKCHVLPHLSKLSMAERKEARVDDWYQLQGFYIYRGNRLLLFGDWLGLFPKNEHYKNARILVDIPNSMDHDWKIDIKKSTATPSVSVRKDLVRLGKLTRLAAGNVHRFRGNQIRLDDSVQGLDFQAVWKATLSREGARSYYINEQHPLVKSLLDSESIKPKELRQLLKLIGQTSPVEAIIQYHSEEPQSHELRESFKELDEGTVKLAKMMYEASIAGGMSRDMAIKQIFKIEPFNEYPELTAYLN